MPEPGIGWTGLAASLVLVAVAVGLSFAQRLRLEGPILQASSRAAIQLLLVGWALQLVLRPDQPVVWAFTWVVAMVVFAAFTVRRRAPEVPAAFSIALVATAAVAIVSLGVIFGFGVFPLEGRAVVPLAGMMIGNSMTSEVLAARRIVAELRDKRPEVEARLALGYPWRSAAAPYVRDALRTALVPQIEATKAVGLVILPGAMTGLILAGVDPFDAVVVQLAIMYLVLGSVATSVTVVGVGLTRRLFTPDHRLVRLARPAP
ncbi:MAG: iron export ABC transporter permease subunit FetB [Acidimicrobiales bacterium]